MHAARPGARRGAAATGALALALTTAGCLPDQGPSAAPTHVAPAVTKTATTGPTPSTEVPTADPGPTPGPTVSAPPTSTPAAPPPVVLLRAGDTGSKVRALQARLRQIGWFSGDVTNSYGPRTTAAVKGFQGKRGFPATGTLDEPTWKKLLSMTHEPTRDELANTRPETEPGAIVWDVDERCLTGRVMCISKDARKLTWVIDGVPQYQFSVRFGSDELPTREGVFTVYKKKIDVVSNLYHTPMPYSMFFSGGQAVHYSSNFARLGYSGTSHGCVNVRDWDGIVRLYNESAIGDKVVIHW